MTGSGGCLRFHTVELPDKKKLDPYLKRWGGGSCQHSFQALYAFQPKYHSEICEYENCLYIRQPANDEDSYESYLMPMTDKDRPQALSRLIEDVHSRGKRVKLQTITGSYVEFLTKHFPDRFTVSEERGYAEYLYRTSRLAQLGGSELQKLRYFYKRFYRDYGTRTEVEQVTPAKLAEIIEFQEQWLNIHSGEVNASQLNAEHQAILRVCSHFEELEFRGITVRIDGKLCGYALGCGISENTFDVFFEKGRQEFRDIYRCLVTDMVRIHGTSFDYVNREEDLSDRGLRMSKLSYHPDILMKKYIARERDYE